MNTGIETRCQAENKALLHAASYCVAYSKSGHSNAERCYLAWCLFVQHAVRTSLKRQSLQPLSHGFRVFWVVLPWKNWEKISRPLLLRIFFPLTTVPHWLLKLPCKHIFLSVSTGLWVSEVHLQYLTSAVFLDVAQLSITRTQPSVFVLSGNRPAWLGFSGRAGLSAHTRRWWCKVWVINTQQARCSPRAPCFLTVMHSNLVSPLRASATLQITGAESNAAVCQHLRSIRS